MDKYEVDLGRAGKFVMQLSTEDAKRYGKRATKAVAKPKPKPAPAGGGEGK